MLSAGPSTARSISVAEARPGSRFLEVIRTADPRPPGPFARLGEPLAQRGDVRLDERGRALRRPLRPDRVDQPVDGDDPARLGQQRREHGTRFRAAQADGAVFGPHLDRAEYPEIHQLALPVR
jgi:hypothetical protein